MQKEMTFYTDRNNIEPVLWCIAFMVMVVVGLAAAGTYHAFDRGEFSTINGIANSIFGLGFLWKFSLVSLVSGSIRYHAFLALMISFLCFSALLACFVSASCRFVFGSLVKCLHARLAISPKPISVVSIFMKITNGPKLLASRTSFCYTLLRHGFSLIKKLCLEPLQTQYLCGSLYYTAAHSLRKQKLTKFLVK